MHPRYIKHCRACGSGHLAPVIDLGAQFLQGSFVKEGYPEPPRRRLPTQLVRCDVTQDDRACGLLQLAHTFPPEVLYLNYWYRSGTNRTMTEHLGGIARDAAAVVGEGDRRVLDIGCNDGTLLNAYPEGWARYGVDPSDIARSIPPPTTVVNTVFPSERAFAAFGEQKFDIVTSIAMFYDLDDPVGFAEAVQRVLAPKGVWVLEMSYLPLMLMQNAFDTICHEHLEYYSLAVLEQIVGKAGLRVFRAELNDINGGSIRCYVCHDANSEYDSGDAMDDLRRLRLKEFDLELDTDRPYAEFQARISALRDETMALLQDIRMRRESVHLYGASTKGNVILQWYGIDRMIVEAAADRNPDKNGATTLGTGIPIVDEETSRAMKPDYFLVLPWHFKREFLERERETILAGTKMIFPLPRLAVVDRENLSEHVEDAASRALAADFLGWTPERGRG